MSIFPIRGWIGPCLIFAFGSLLGAVHAQTAAPANLLVKDGQKVVFMGDSITGLGWSESGGYVHLVTSGLETLGVKITPIGAGVGGNKSNDMLARLDKDVLSVKPDWLLLSCGVNDVWSRSIDLDTFKKNMTSIVDQAQAAGIKVMILTPTPIYEANVTEFSRLSDYVAFLNQLAQERKIPVADLNAAYFAYLKAQPPNPTNANLLTVDGVHPNPNGHQVMAQGVLEAFGATPDQIAKIKQAWLDMPGGATLSMGIGFRGADSITLRDYAALQKLADDKKITLAALINGAYLEAIVETIKTHDDYTKIIPDNISHDSLPLFKQKIDDLVKAAQSLPAK